MRVDAMDNECVSVCVLAHGLSGRIVRRNHSFANMVITEKQVSIFDPDVAVVGVKRPE